MKKQIIVQIKGGLGKHIIFTSLLPKLKEKYSEGVHISASHSSVFTSNPNVATLNEWQNLDYKNILNNSKIVASDPYSQEDFIMKRQHLLETWADMLEINYDPLNDLPSLYFEDNELEDWEKIYSEFKNNINNKPFFLIQMAGGQNPNSYAGGGFQNSFSTNSDPLKRAYPLIDFISLVKKLKSEFPDHEIIRFGLPNELIPFEISQDVIDIKKNMSYKFFSMLSNEADCVISIDSSLQHITAVGRKPSIVIWGETSPEHFGYNMHINLKEKQDYEIAGYWSLLGPGDKLVKFPSPENVIDSVKKYIESNKEKKEDQEILNVSSENKNVIVTWANDKNKTFLSEFIVSLRTLGNYFGKLIVIDYGLPNMFKEKFNENIEYLSYDSNGLNIETHKLISALDITRKYKNVVLLDADMWFQGDINNIFNEIEHSEGILCSSEINPFFFNFQKRMFHNLKNFDLHVDKIYKIKEAFGAQLNAGFIAGKGEVLFNRLSKFISMLENGELKKEWGSDQMFLNIDFDFEKDNGYMTEYNTIITNAVNISNSHLGYYDDKNNIACLSKVLHVAGSIFHIPVDIKKTLFRFRHKDLYENYLKQKGIYNIFDDDSSKEKHIKEILNS
jgi:ADP-heptose:LPS heptosyltransferase